MIGVLLILLTASQIHQIADIQIFVVYKGGMDSGATRMVRTKVIQLCIPTEQVALFLVYHEFLDQFILVLGHVQMVACWRLPSPAREEIAED